MDDRGRVCLSDNAGRCLTHGSSGNNTTFSACTINLSIYVFTTDFNHFTKKKTLGLKKKNISIHVFTTDFYHSHTYIKKKLSNYQYIHILTDYFYLHNSVLSSDDLDYELKRTPLQPKLYLSVSRHNSNPPPMFFSTDF